MKMFENNTTVTVCLEQKVNLGNYETAAVSVALCGLPIAATEEEMDAALETARIAYKKIAARLKEKVEEIRGGKQ